MNNDKINSASRRIAETGVLPLGDVHATLDGIDFLQHLCHDLASLSGWWNRKLPALPDDDGLRVMITADMAEFGYPIGGKLTPAEVAGIVPEKLCLTHSELSEAMEGHRRGLMDDKLPHRPMLEVELADALIRIMDLAGALKLDLAGATIEKLAFNQDRADHKPEARAAEGGKGY